MATIGSGMPMAQAKTVQFIWAKREGVGFWILFIKVRKHSASQSIRDDTRDKVIRASERHNHALHDARLSIRDIADYQREVWAFPENPHIDYKNCGISAARSAHVGVRIYPWPT